MRVKKLRYLMPRCYQLEYFYHEWEFSTGTICAHIQAPVEEMRRVLHELRFDGMAIINWDLARLQEPDLDKRGDL